MATTEKGAGLLRRPRIVVGLLALVALSLVVVAGFAFAGPGSVPVQVSTIPGFSPLPSRSNQRGSLFKMSHMLFGTMPVRSMPILRSSNAPRRDYPNWNGCIESTDRTCWNTSTR